VTQSGFGGFPAVSTSTDYLALADDDAAHRNLALRTGFPGQRKGLIHKHKIFHHKPPHYK
jgi:hypothetical protein